MEESGLEETMAKGFSNLEKEMDIQIQKAHGLQLGQTQRSPH